MPLLLPFHRSDAGEKWLRAAALAVVAAAAAFVAVPLGLMVVLSVGDAADWRAGARWPDLRHFSNPARLYVHYLATRFDYWPAGLSFDRFYRATFGPDETILSFPGAPVPRGPWRRRAQDALDCLSGEVPWTHVQPLFTGWFYGDSESEEASALLWYTGLGEEAWKRHLKRAYRDIAAVNARFGTEFPTFAHVKTPAPLDLGARAVPTAGDPWLGEYRGFVGNVLSPLWRTIRPGGAVFAGYLKGRPDVEGDLARANALLGASYAAWSEVELPVRPPGAPARAVWEAFVRTAASPYLLEIEVDARTQEAFRAHLLRRYGTEERARQVHGARTGDGAIALPATAHRLEEAPEALEDWDRFVRTLPLDRLRVLTAEEIWRRFLTARYRTVAELNAAHGTALRDHAEAPWPQPELDRLDWEANRWRYTAEIVLKNYRRAWAWMTAATPALWNTLRFAFLFTLLSTTVNAAAAYTLSRWAAGPWRLSLVLFLALSAFPLEALAIPNFVLLRDLNLLNTVWALALPTAVNGYFIYLLKWAFDAIPRDYYDEAVVCGASEWSLFWRVGLTFAAPVILVVGLYAFLWAYSNFMWSLVVCQKPAEWTLPVLLFNVRNWEAPDSVVAASAALTFLPALAVGLLGYRPLQRATGLPRP